MLRFLLIAGLILYVLYKIGSFFFKAGAASQQLRNQQPNDGYQNGYNHNAQAKPQKEARKRDGEYIDYEEVK